MPRLTTIVDFSEILEVAVEEGYEWNEAHEILDIDGIRPEAECSSVDYQVDNFDEGNEDYEWSPHTRKIMQSVFRTHGLTEFTLLQ